jgi:hypothetical protein
MRTVAARNCSLVVRAVTNTAHRRLIAAREVGTGVRIGFTSAGTTEPALRALRIAVALWCDAGIGV